MSRADRVRTGAFVALAIAGLSLWAAAPSRYGDLDDHFTDHLRHMGEALAFAQHGFDVYERPYGQMTQDLELPCPAHAGLWAKVTAPYPPLALLSFYPAAAAERGHLLTPASSHRVVVLGLILWAVACGWLCLELLRRDVASLVVFAATGLPLLFGAGANGFYDVMFMCAGAAGLLAAQRGRHGIAVLAFCVAGALHFRALVFAPIAAAEVYYLVRQSTSRRTLVTIAAVALALAIPTAAAALELDVSGMEITNPVRGERWRFYLLGAVTAGVVLAFLRERSWIAAATTVVAFWLSFADRQHCWWHALVFLVPALVHAVRPGGGWIGRCAGWAWMIAASLIAFIDPWPPFWEWLRLFLSHPGAAS